MTNAAHKMLFLQDLTEELGPTEFYPVSGPSSVYSQASLPMDLKLTHYVVASCTGQRRPRYCATVRGRRLRPTSREQSLRRRRWGGARMSTNGLFTRSMRCSCWFNPTSAGTVIVCSICRLYLTTGCITAALRILRPG